MPCSVFYGIEKFFGTQLCSLLFLTLVLFKLGRTLSIGSFGLSFGNLHVKFYRTLFNFLYTCKLYFNPVLLVLLVL
jgi:hypothetical protein